YNLYGGLRQQGLSEASVQRANMLFDGIPLKAATLILRGTWLPDLNGSDLFPLVMRSAPADLRVFLLGGQPDVVRLARQVIETRWPNVRLVGAETGYFKADEAWGALQRINDARPDILPLGLGSPYKEK